MKNIKIKLLRATKWLFIRLHIHILLGPFEKLLLSLAHLSDLSRWVHKNKNKCSNDYFSSWNYNARFTLYADIIQKHTNSSSAIDYLEFGVAKGDSFKWWLEQQKHPESKFYGFDTFEGLPEDWGGFKAGEMSADSHFPKINDKRGFFFKGLFQNTLPDFLKKFDGSRQKIILMDADLYSSTLFVLTSLAPYLKKGDVILFDEFTVPMHEFLAFNHFIKSYYLKFELLGGANNFYFTGFKLI